MINECVNILSLSVQSQNASRFDNLGWHNIGWGTQNWVTALIFPLIILLVGTVIYVLIYNWYTVTRKESYDKKQRTERLNGIIRKHSISGEEYACLQLFTGYTKSSDVLSIIENPELFEKCVDSTLEEALKSSPESAENTAATIESIRKKIGFDTYPTDRQFYSTRVIPAGQTCSLYNDENSKEPIIKSATLVTNNELQMRLKFKPESRTSTMPIARQSMLRMVFSRSNDGFYGAFVPVLGIPSADALELGHTTNLKRSQLRKFVRINTNIRVKGRMIKPALPQQPSIPVGQSFDAAMKDISGGGMSFSFPKSLHNGDLITLSFHLDNTSVSGLQGTILRITERNINEQTLFLHHVKFNAITTPDQEKIVRFIFEQMRLLATWDVKRFK